MKARILSKPDSQVLKQVFDPGSAPATVEILIDPGLAQDPHILDQEVLDQLKAREREAIAIVEQFESAASVRLSQQKAFESSIAILDECIASQPAYASARNNRAQLLRWRYGDRETLCQNSSRPNEKAAAAGSAAVKDLRAAISLASPKRPQDAISPAQGRLLAQSYTQLAALHYAAVKDLEGSPDVLIVAAEFSSWDKVRFEEEASGLFYVGGLYGNQVAKALAVHANPHAKLCGNIVHEAMRKELVEV